MEISIETRVPPARAIGNPRKALKIQAFLTVRNTFFARRIPLVFYSSLDWEMSKEEKHIRGSPATESQPK